MSNESNTDQNQAAQQDLCLSCGLCCKGILHDYVGLTDSEMPLIEVHALDWHPKGIGFLLPCQKFEGSCTIYEDRPETCREFKCGVLTALTEDRITYQEARQKIERVEGLIDQINLTESWQGSNESVSTKSFWKKLNGYLAEQEKSLGATENFLKNGVLVALAARLKELLHDFDDRYY